MASAPTDGPHDTKGPEIIAVTSVFSAAATVCVAGRFYSRKIKGLAWGADDWTILLALAIIWVLFGITEASVRYGGGSHIYDIPEPREDYQRMLYAHNTVYVLSTPMVKFSLLLLYRRIFVQRTFHIVIWAVGGVIAAWMVTVWFMAIFFCSPIYGFWVLSIHSQCLDFKHFAEGFFAVNIVTDVVIWILPIPMIWQLHLRSSQKALLISVFLLGLFVWAASIVRFITSILILGDPDASYTLSNAYIWSIVEPAVGVICACLPTLRVLLRIPGQLSGNSTRSHRIEEENPISNHSRWSKKFHHQSNSHLQSVATHSLDPRECESHAQVLELDGRARLPTPPEEGIQVSHEVSVEARSRSRCRSEEPGSSGP